MLIQAKLVVIVLLLASACDRPAPAPGAHECRASAYFAPTREALHLDPHVERSVILEQVEAVGSEIGASRAWLLELIDANTEMCWLQARRDVVHVRDLNASIRALCAPVYPERG